MRAPLVLTGGVDIIEQQAGTEPRASAQAGSALAGSASSAAAAAAPACKIALPPSAAERIKPYYIPRKREDYDLMASNNWKTWLQEVGVPFRNVLKEHPRAAQARGQPPSFRNYLDEFSRTFRVPPKTVKGVEKELLRSLREALGERGGKERVKEALQPQLEGTMPLKLDRFGKGVTLRKHLAAHNIVRVPKASAVEALERHLESCVLAPLRDFTTQWLAEPVARQLFERGVSSEGYEPLLQDCSKVRPRTASQSRHAAIARRLCSCCCHCTAVERGCLRARCSSAPDAVLSRGGGGRGSWRATLGRDSTRR